MHWRSQRNYDTRIIWENCIAQVYTMWDWPPWVFSQGITTFQKQGPFLLRGCAMSLWCLQTRSAPTDIFLCAENSANFPCVVWVYAIIGRGFESRKLGWNAAFYDTVFKNHNYLKSVSRLIRVWTTLFSKYSNLVCSFMTGSWPPQAGMYVNREMWPTGGFS